MLIFGGHSFAKKMTWVVLAASSLALCTLTSAFLLFDYVRSRSERQSQLSTLADVVGQNSRAALSFRNPTAATEVLRALRAEHSVVAACLYEFSGHLFAHYEQAQSSMLCPPTLPQARPVRASYSIEMRPVFRDGDVVGMLCLTSDDHNLRQRHKHLLAMAGALLALSLAVGWVSGSLLQRKFSAPLSELAQVMRNVTHDQTFTARVSIAGSDEIAQLGSCFNSMLAEIQRREEDLRRSNIRLEDELIQRKETNQQLAKAKEEAEIANRTKSEFLANMSHEIRTPMNGVIGMTELALETNLTPEQREYLSTVKLSAESLLSIINDILDFSKIEVGRLELDSFEFNIHEVIGSTLKGIAIRAHQKGLELVYDIRPSVPDVLVGDAHRLRQILVNLVANAIKFTDRGEVVVTLDAAPQRGPNMIHMLVRDTGIGIPRDKQDVVFEAFSQADSSHSRRYGGTGLGLAITSRLVGLMGGEIWVRSEPGQGSEFHVLVPLPGGSPEGLVVPEFLRGVSALIVDDNLTQRKILSGMLSQWGMKPDAAESALRGLSAMEAAAGANATYRLVLIDGNMPGMDGFELAECIQRNPQLTGATVLMLSTGLRPGDINRCRELGVSAYVIKPIRKGELLNVIVRVLQNKDAFAAPEQEQSLYEGERRSRLQILAAEDNRVNQRLLVRLLEKEGHTVTIVEDGEAAVAITGKQEFDIILMDVQMPNLDGLEATRCIRSRELATGKHVPIIALTAHAMKGDRERCLQAGMDAYVAKPVQKQELLHIMYQYIVPSPGDLPEARGIQYEFDLDVFDLAKGLEYSAGDEAVLAELCELFLQDCPEFEQEIRQQIARGDTQAVAHTAHKLKTSVGTIGGTKAYGAALALESHARDGASQPLTAAASQLLRELAVLQAAVIRFLSSRQLAVPAETSRPYAQSGSALTP